MGKAAVILCREVIAPRLGWSSVVIILLDFYVIGNGSQLLPKEQAVLLATVGVISFWISLRVLLRVPQPPIRALASVLFALHLLNLAVLLVATLLAVLLLPGLG